MFVKFNQQFRGFHPGVTYELADGVAKLHIEQGRAEATKKQKPKQATRSDPAKTNKLRAAGLKPPPQDLNPAKAKRDKPDRPNHDVDSVDK